MAENAYSGPCAWLLNCVKSWREREQLRRHREFLRAGDDLLSCVLFPARVFLLYARLPCNAIGYVRIQTENAEEVRESAYSGSSLIQESRGIHEGLSSWKFYRNKSLSVTCVVASPSEVGSNWHHMYHTA